MTGKEIRKAIRQASAVFGWVNITADDGEYLQLTKQSATASCPAANDTGDFGPLVYQAEMRGDELYIN